MVFAIKSLVVRGGGAERVLVTIVNHLVETGVDVTVVTLDTAQDSFYKLHPSVSWIRLGISAPGVSSSAMNLARFIYYNRQIVKRRQPDLYVGFMHSIFVAAQISVLGLNVKFIASEHIDISHYKTRPLQRLLVNAIHSKHLFKTVPSTFVRNQYPIGFLDKIVVLNNPVDDVFFDSNPVSDKDNNLVVVGRFMEQKNHYELFDAFALISSEFSSWKLLVYGEGPLELDLKQKVKKLGLENQIHFKGYVSDVASVFCSSKFSVLPSFYESFGLVAAESLACGCPVLAFDDCLGLDEILDENNSLRVSGNGDRTANLAQGLRSLMSNHFLLESLGASAKRSVLRYRSENIKTQWSEFFQRCVSYD